MDLDALGQRMATRKNGADDRQWTEISRRDADEAIRGLIRNQTHTRGCSEGCSPRADATMLLAMYAAALEGAFPNFPDELKPARVCAANLNPLELQPSPRED